jgi:hypothetical protein
MNMGWQLSNDIVLLYDDDLLQSQTKRKACHATVYSKIGTYFYFGEGGEALHLL